jgi:hypothetical protein
MRAHGRVLSASEAGAHARAGHWRAVVRHERARGEQRCRDVDPVSSVKSEFGCHASKLGLAWAPHARVGKLEKKRNSESRQKGAANKMHSGGEHSHTDARDTYTVVLLKRHQGRVTTAPK